MTYSVAVDRPLCFSPLREPKRRPALVRATRNLFVLLAMTVAGAVGASAQDTFASPSGHEFGEPSRQGLGEVFKAAKKKEFEAFMATAASRYIQHSPDLHDGWKPVCDLLAKRPEGFSSRSTDWLGPKGMLDCGNYLIMLREVNRGDGTPPSKIVDIMIFDEADKYAEHWDIRQPLSEETASGRSETDAADVFLRAPVKYTEEVEEKNKSVAVAFLKLAFHQNKLGQALDRYVSKDYVQHNPLIADGSAAVREIFEAGKLPPLQYDIQLVLAQNDIVVVYSKVEVSGKQMAVVDILRIREGVLVEHWDVLQEVPSAEKMPHTNGMFSIPGRAAQGR